MKIKMKNCREADQNELDFRDMCGQCAVRDRSEKRRSEQNRALFQSGDRRNDSGDASVSEDQDESVHSGERPDPSKNWTFFVYRFRVPDHF